MLALLSLFIAATTAQQPFNPQNLTIQQCTSAGCTPTTKRIALDSTSNHTSPSGQELITIKGDAMTLTYNSEVGGPRVYLIEEEGVNENHLFMLKTQEFSFDVELSSMPCGFNAALYFVGMDKNAGYAVNGTHYCDAQAVAGVFCSEMDIMEANTMAQQYTTHGCIDECASYSTSPQCKGGPTNICDQSGCGLNPFRYGPGTTYKQENDNPNWYGPGAGYNLTSTQKYTAVTQFWNNPLTNITRFYVQNGKRVDLPTLYVEPPTDGQHYGPFRNPSITAKYCTDIYDRWSSGGGPLSQMSSNMDHGMVLTMSAWYAKETYPLSNGEEQTGMSWLDGENYWGGHITKAGPCDTTTNDAGVHYAIFSNIRIGDIGTTTNY
eukprot:21012_1